MTITTPDWVQDATFYQIFPDRFAKSNRNPVGNLPFESWDSPPTPHGFKGGDLYGIAEKLDYLKDLGVGAIWFSPIAPVISITRRESSCRSAPSSALRFKARLPAGS